MALAARFSQGAQRVLGLAALAHGYDERAAIQRRIAQAEFAGPVDLHRKISERFNEIFADHAGMHGGAAAGDKDAVDLPQFLGR